MTPWHPAIVHIPLGAAMALPFLSAATAAGIVALGWPRRTFGLVALLLALQFGGAWAAHESGEDEEHRLGDAVPHEAVERHAEWGNNLWRLSGVLLVVAVGAALLRREDVGRGLIALTVAGSLGTAICAYEAGEHGGELVWEHGAASAKPESESTSNVPR